jgi:DNA gyrase subunit A
VIKTLDNAIEIVNIETEMKRSYLDYAMSVIVSRALPDCRDGMKPVHRRILFAMYESNYFHDKPYKKSARIVGDVMGKYHPHGNDAIYLSLVRMAQDFALRIPLIDGQGNFGSMDGDAPAQMRYTEARLAKISSFILEDLAFDTVNFRDNYDGSEVEPEVLPARFPQLLVNGVSGIAVGMATNIPTHNLGEVIDAALAYIENSNVTVEELLELVPGPDFPTGGIIMGMQKAKRALATGRGSVPVKAKSHFEEIGNRDAIIITEVPYQVNKAELLMHVEQLVRNKDIEGIAEIRDESNKLGVRMVIEIKKDATSSIVLNQLMKMTQLSTSISYNMLALRHNRPTLMGLRDFIMAFVEFREEVVERRTRFLLGKARNRAHILIGLAIAVSNIDAIIIMIKSSRDTAEARSRLTETAWKATNVIPLLNLVQDDRNHPDGEYCKLTLEQANAILDMKLQRLTALEKDRIDNELHALANEIGKYLQILSSKEQIMSVISEELKEIKEKFGTPRLTHIEANENELSIEELIEKEDMVVTITMSGYIKCVPLATYRAQRRGGKGRFGVNMQDEDYTTDVIITHTHETLLFFSDAGKVYTSRVYKLPVGTPQSKGRAIVNILPIAQGERITTVVSLPADKENWPNYSILFSTSSGSVRRNSLSAFSNIPSGGKIAIKMDSGDRLVGVIICDSNAHILLATKLGKAIRFPISSLRVFQSRTSAGVRGIKLQNKDVVISMTALQGSEIAQEIKDQYLRIPSNIRMTLAGATSILEATAILGGIDIGELDIELVMKLAQKEEFILSVTERGYGKRTSAYEYRITNRGGSGILNITTSARNGNMVASLPVANNDVMLVTDGGKMIRISLNDVRITGRNTMGVKMIDMLVSEKVVSVSKIIENNDDQEDENE